MKKILEWLSHWDKDKILHDDVVFTITMLAACVCRLLIGRQWDRITAAAFFSGFLAAILKEVYDEWKYKGADSADWAADVSGLFRGTLFAAVLSL